MEYCIMHPLYTDWPHRGPWSLEECEGWLNEWEKDGGRKDMFYIAARTVSPWQRLDYAK